MLPSQTFEGITQRSAADVEPHEQIAVEGLQQRGDLARVPDAELHQDPCSQRCRDGLCLLVQQGDFGSRQAVFRLLADGREEP